MGGLGAWMLGVRYRGEACQLPGIVNIKYIISDKFAAVVPICGGGPVVYAPLLKDMPM